MRLAAMSLVIALVLPVHAMAEAGDPAAQSVDLEAKVATWDGGAITVRDYVDWWRYLPEADRAPLVDMEEKIDFLDNMISARLMMAASESLGIDRRPGIIEFIAKRRIGLLTETLLKEATEGRILVTEEEIEELFNKRRIQVNITRIIVPTNETAVALIDSMDAGVPMEDLARRHSDCPTGRDGGKMGPLRWGDLNDYWSQQVFNLEEGEVSKPFRVEGGYAIVRVDSKMDVSTRDADAEIKSIKGTLAQRKAFEERFAYIDSLRAAYGYEIHMDEIIDLCVSYAKALAEEGETREVVDTDIMPVFDPGGEDAVLVSYDGWTLTAGECAEQVVRTPYQARPVYDDPDNMFTYVRRVTTDSVLVAEAEKLGFDERPEIKMELEKVKRRKTTLVLFRHLTDGAVVPEDSVRAFYDAHGENFMQQAGYKYHKMLLGSRAVADSLMDLLEKGSDFEALARESSLDPFTAPRGGFVPFQAIEQDTEFDTFFESMDEGETRYFRSLEGHVILMLDEKYEARPSTFEEARSTIENRLSPAYKDRLLIEWIEKQREGRNIKIEEAVLEAISLGA